MNLRFSSHELRDLTVAWVVLGVAFAIFFAGGGSRAVSMLLDQGVVGPLLVSLVTAGFGFLLHELAHKVVAVRFDQIAEFRADYGMLFLAVMSALVGFLFAAPGAVHHRGRLTAREHGLIALAGPVTNGLLALVFAPVYVAGLLAGSPLLSLLGARGVAINLFLAAFNLVPFGGLDGRTVLDWSKGVFALTFLPAAAAAVFVVFVLGIGF
ncbi:metalloprotease [Haloplanus halophilus]|uniref:metalloprotease n=1 Tax=Haloplanus halophilus TaxID=2949993 RepID=UPI0020418610|nr:metalloprotease [Haloplanus sp. GDY1]